MIKYRGLCYSFNNIDSGYFLKFCALTCWIFLPCLLTEVLTVVADPSTECIGVWSMKYSSLVALNPKKWVWGNSIQKIYLLQASVQYLVLCTYKNFIDH